MTDSLSSSPRPKSSCSTTNRRKPLSRSLRAKPALERIFSSCVWTNSGLKVFWASIQLGVILPLPARCFNVIAVLVTPRQPPILCISVRLASSWVMRVLLLSTLLSASFFGQSLEGTSGTWKMNAARSRFGGSAPFKSLTVRIERHPKGEVFTLDRIETSARATNYSTILYLDGEPRPFDDFGCSGIQLSRRADDRTVEIVRMCSSGGWMRLLRRASAKANELVLEITEQSADGRR